MRYACFQYAGARHVGLVSDDGQHVRPFLISPEEARRGVQVCGKEATPICAIQR